MSNRVWHNVKDMHGVQQALRALSPTRLMQYTPAWSGSGGTPAIGDGSIVGTFVRNNFLCLLTINISFSSTTVGSTGTWSWSLPALRAGTEPVMGAMAIRDSGSNFRTGVCTIQNSPGDTLIAYVDSGTSQIGEGVPITWADDDWIRMSIVYPIGV